MATASEADGEQSWALVRYFSMPPVNKTSNRGSASSNLFERYVPTAIFISLFTEADNYRSDYSPLLNLPPELCNQIWGYVLNHDVIEIDVWGDGIGLCATTYNEAYTVNKLRLELGPWLLLTVYRIQNRHPPIKGAIDSPLDCLPRTSSGPPDVTTSRNFWRTDLSHV
jgi:hypothetical protein